MAKKAVRGAKMPKATGHTVGGLGRPKAPQGSTAKRGAAAVTGPQVAKPAHGS